MNNFWQRAITGSIFVLVLVSAILAGGWYMHALFALIVFLALQEFYNLFDQVAANPQKITGTLLGALLYFFLVVSIYQEQRFLIVGMGLALMSFVIIAIQELFRKKSTPFENVALTLSGLVYIVLPFFLLSLISVQTDSPDLEHEYKLILSLFILVWANDTFAYLTGKWIGKHKLFERISPKKTWEGFAGGILFAMIAGIILAYIFDGSYFNMMVYGLIVGVIGTLGDLVQSMLKRSVHVKDSGSILPGHGGVLDRFDGVLFVVPVIFFLEQFVLLTTFSAL